MAYDKWKYFADALYELTGPKILGIDPGFTYSMALWGKFEEEYLLIGLTTEKLHGKSQGMFNSTFDPGRQFNSLLEDPQVGSIFIEAQFVGPKTHNGKLSSLIDHAATLVAASLNAGKDTARIEPRVWRNAYPWGKMDHKLAERFPYLHQNEWKSLAMEAAPQYLLGADIPLDDNEAEAILIGYVAAHTYLQKRLELYSGPFKGANIPYEHGEDKVAKITKENISEYVKWKYAHDVIPY